MTDQRTEAAKVLGVLTLEQAAEVCGVHPKTVQRAISAGDLRASQVAKRGAWVIAVEDFYDWLDRRANRPRAVPAAEPIQPVPAAAPPLRRRGSPPAGRLSVTDGMGRAA